MLNRRHIRVKAMQVLYMHWQTEKESSIKHLESTFDTNIAKMYRLYLYYLAFLKEMWHYGVTQDDRQRQQSFQGNKGAEFQLKLYQNPLLTKLFNDPSFEKELSSNAVAWNTGEDEGLIKRLFNDFKNSERFSDYHQFFNETGQHADIVLHIIKHYSEHNSQFEQHIEEEFPNVSDDFKLVFSMLRKTLHNLETKDDDFFVTLVQDEENTVVFGRDLIRTVVEKDNEIDPILKAKITKWEPGQVAVTDLIILKMGIAEFMFFPSIPHTVTINEYVELSKQYSPPKSKKFINGLLDTVSKELSKNPKQTDKKS